MRRRKSRRYPKSFYEKLEPKPPWCEKCQFHHDIEKKCILPKNLIVYDDIKVKTRL